MLLRLFPLLLLLTPLGAAPRELRIEVLSGEGATYVVGTRAATGLIVRVADESGKPVEGARVQFQAPAAEPTVLFTGGMPLETVTTGGNGRAEIWGAKAADTPGTFEILVTARKDGVEATAVIGQSIVLPSSTARAAGGKKWIWLVLVAAGGAAAAAVSAGGGGKSSAAPPPSSGGILNPNVPRIPGAQIGLPSIVIGAP